MSASDLDFSYRWDPTLDREDLLRKASEQVDQLAGFLGPQGAPQPTEAGDLLRSLQNDNARFAHTPIVYGITDADYIKKGMPAPVELSQAAGRYSFYWIHVPVLLFPRRDWAFNRLEVALEFFNTHDAGAERPRAFQILPEKQFQTLLEISDRLEVRLDEHLKFDASVPAIATPVGGAEVGVDVKMAGEAGMVVGPFVYQIKRARIDHTAVGLERIFWRIDGAQYFQESTADLVVIAQVPRASDPIRIKAALQAYRYFHLLGTQSLRDALRELPAGLRTFFEAGAPLRRTGEWELQLH